MIQTGYFGTPGSNRGSFTVHVINDGRPICKYRPGPEMIFQWCAHGIVWNYLECENCIIWQKSRKAMCRFIFGRAVSND